ARSLVHRRSVWPGRAGFLARSDVRYRPDRDGAAGQDLHRRRGAALPRPLRADPVGTGTGLPAVPRPSRRFLAGGSGAVLTSVVGSDHRAVSFSHFDRIWESEAPAEPLHFPQVTDWLGGPPFGRCPLALPRERNGPETRIPGSVTSSTAEASRLAGTPGTGVSVPSRNRVRSPATLLTQPVETLPINQSIHYAEVLTTLLRPRSQEAQTVDGPTGVLPSDSTLNSKGSAVI